MSEVSDESTRVGEVEIPYGAAQPSGPSRALLRNIAISYAVADVVAVVVLLRTGFVWMVPIFVVLVGLTQVLFLRKTYRRATGRAAPRAQRAASPEIEQAIATLDLTRVRAEHAGRGTQAALREIRRQQPALSRRDSVLVFQAVAARPE